MDLREWVENQIAEYRNTQLEEIFGKTDHLKALDIILALEEELEPNALAKKFHEAYERLAPSFQYKTRKETAVSWDDLPINNKALMIAVCREIAEALKGVK